jgi:hypothetical protein
MAVEEAFWALVIGIPVAVICIIAGPIVGKMWRWWENKWR